MVGPVPIHISETRVYFFKNHDEEGFRRQEIDDVDIVDLDAHNVRDVFFSRCNARQFYAYRPVPTHGRHGYGKILIFCGCQSGVVSLRTDPTNKNVGNRHVGQVVLPGGF